MGIPGSQQCWYIALARILVRSLGQFESSIECIMNMHDHLEVGTSGVGCYQQGCIWGCETKVVDGWRRSSEDGIVEGKAGSLFQGLVWLENCSSRALLLLRGPIRGSGWVRTVIGSLLVDSSHIHYDFWFQLMSGSEWTVWFGRSLSIFLVTQV